MIYKNKCVHPLLPSSVDLKSLEIPKVKSKAEIITI